MHSAFTIRLVGVSLFMISLWHGALTAFASDHWNLEEQMPTEVEDAYAADYLIPELQTVFRYEHRRHGQDQFILVPRLAYGFARNWHARIAAPFLMGSADTTGSGNTELEVFRQFNEESSYLPALALVGKADLPTGRNSQGVDTTLKFITTKALDQNYLLHRVHLNFSWDHNAGPQVEERRDRYTTVLGYSHLLPTDTVLVTDVVREQEMEKGKTDSIVEAGIRRMLTPVSVMSVGAGAGIGHDSPAFRITVGLQYSF